MKIVLASNNAGKLAELQAMFAGLPVQLLRQSELGIGEAPEPYRTFLENALTKARHAAAASGLPALADDAGCASMPSAACRASIRPTTPPSSAMRRAMRTTCARCSSSYRA